MRRHIKWIPLVVIVIIIIAGLVYLIVNLQNGHKLPCNYLDSINITDGTLQPDSSIRYNNIIFPKDQYFDINYVLRNGSKTHIGVHPPYRRGCLCNMKPCVRLCCPAGVFYNNVNFKCQRYTNESANRLEHDVLDKHNDTENWVLNDHFAFVYDKPCQGMFIADDGYDITYKGNVLFENRSRSHHEYCLAPIAAPNHTGGTYLELHACPTEENAEILRLDILPYFMLASVPFLIVTFLVYVCLPELRNLHGKCLLGYLMCMAVGYTCLGLVLINGDRYIDPLLCKCAGFTIYFSFLSAFLWSNVISCDLWWNFQKTNIMLSERRRFLLYMIYVWGISSMLTIIALTLNSIGSIAERWRIGIGEETCFLKPGKGENLSRLLYFYLPLCIIWAINVLFFVLTVRRIILLQLELKVMLKNESSRHQRKLNKDKENFLMYLRLSMLMGVTWIMEGISYFASQGSPYFLITDIWNCAQGVLIFVLFVLKRRILQLIRKRCDCCNEHKNAAINDEMKTRETTFT